MERSTLKLLGYVVGIGAVSISTFIGLRALNYILFKNYDRRKALKESDAEIDNEFYNSKWVTWWDYDGAMSGLHAMNPARVGYFEKILNRYLESFDGDIKKSHIFVDIGCGGGLVTEQLSKRGFKMIGFDRSESSLEQARQHAEMAGLDTIYKVGNAYDLSLEIENNSVDGVIMSDVLEHLHDLPRAIKEIGRILKPGGIFVFDTINRNLLSFLLAIVLVQESPFGILPPHAHHWSLFTQPKELRDLLREIGMELKETHGLHVKKDWNLINVVFSKKNVKNVGYYIGGNDSVQYVGYAVKK